MISILILVLSLYTMIFASSWLTVASAGAVALGTLALAIWWETR